MASVVVDDGVAATSGCEEASDLVIEFWADHRYEPYGPRQQEALVELWRRPMRPDQVTMGNGKYVIKDFDKLHLGRAVQVNTITKRERHVRLTVAFGGLGKLAPESFSRSRAMFRFIEQQPTCFAQPEQDSVATGADHAALLESWLRPQAPEAELLLPGGTRVYHLGLLEVGGARASRPMRVRHRLSAVLLRQRHQAPMMALHLELPMPGPGLLTLPAALDEDDDSNEPGAFGRVLTEAEVAGLGCDGSCARCHICIGDFEASIDGVEASGDDGVLQLECGHAYHVGCIRQWFAEKKRCPTCQRDFGKIVGNQPRIGEMRWHHEDFVLPGHFGSAGTFVVEFFFPEGRDDHGVAHGKRKARGYLPCNVQGAVLLELFKVAFRRRVMFGLGHSFATESYRPTFNIHLKTSTSSGVAGHGYPDEDYFERAMEELALNGITRADLPL